VNCESNELFKEHNKSYWLVGEGNKKIQGTVYITAKWDWDYRER